jgi:hypothetical protein
MSSRTEALRKAAQGRKPTENTIVKETVTENAVKQKRKTKPYSIEIDVDDIEKLEKTIMKLSVRDDFRYKKKDIYIAMVKNFIELVDKKIDTIKIEKE